MGKHQCYLCLQFVWDKERNIPVFHGYSLYSTAPWNLSATGLGNAALYVTESDKDYHDAYERMLETIKRLSEMLPGQFWKTVWKWIDPSREAHEERLQLVLDAQKIRQRESEILRMASFTRTPGARLRDHGPWSGEEFRDDRLIPAFNEAQRKGQPLVIDLDGVAGYAASFLDEAFGGMVRKLNIDPEVIIQSMEIVSHDEPELVEEIQGYIREAV